MAKDKKPEWSEHEDHDTSRYLPAEESKLHKSKRKSIKRKDYSIDDYVDGIKSGNLTVLGRALTLVESNSQKHKELAQDILTAVMPATGNSIRVGITGSPGAGKSTFIEALGLMLCSRGHKVAVLAVDPSSNVTGGSILGDKTRMEQLSREKNAFIRPSPSGGTLGGVAKKTREAMLICEAAGYDVILVETVGVGQSETTVKNMTDFFLLLLLPGAGDDLQGIKKGVVELADALVINKADSGNEARANITKTDYRKALHLLSPHTEGWTTEAFTVSAINNNGIDDVWENIEKYIAFTKEKNIFEKKRNSQILNWVDSMLNEDIMQSFYNHPEVKGSMPGIKEQIIAGGKTPANAVKELMEIFFKGNA